MGRSDNGREHDAVHGNSGRIRNNRRSRSSGKAVGAAAVTAAVMAAVLTGCGGGASAPAPTALPIAARGLQSTAQSPAPAAQVEAGLWRKWGLEPLPNTPAPPADKPIKLSATGAVPVISHIPTNQKVVFITLDDGAEKDPKFVAMLQDLKIPITMFLMNDVIKDDYSYFKPLQALGNHIQNHTLHHPPMNTVSLARQKEEVCGDQQVLTKEYGTAPLLFRPPYGALNAESKLAVGACGPRAIVMWRETMQIVNVQYQSADHRLQPGDIILAHFRGPAELKGESMTTMFARLLARIQAQGFAVARLEDYIQAP